MSDTVTITLDREEAEAAKWILGRSPHVERPVGPETAAQSAWDKLRAALDATNFSGEAEQGETLAQCDCCDRNVSEGDAHFSSGVYVCSNCCDCPDHWDQSLATIRKTSGRCPICAAPDPSESNGCADPFHSTQHLAEEKAEPEKCRDCGNKVGQLHAFTCAVRTHGQAVLLEDCQPEAEPGERKL